MDYPSPNRHFLRLNRYFQGQNHYCKEPVFHEDVKIPLIHVPILCPMISDFCQSKRGVEPAIGAPRAQ